MLSQDIDKISGDTVLHQEALSLLEKHAPEFNRFEQAVGIMLQLFKQIPVDQWQLDVREKGYYYYRSTSTIIDLDVVESFVDRCWSDYSTYGEYVKMLAVNEELTKRMKNASYSPNVYNLSLFQYLDAMKVGLFTQDHLFEAIFTNTLASESLLVAFLILRVLIISYRFYRHLTEKSLREDIFGRQKRKRMYSPDC